jgi:hypothetical protein
VGPPFVATGLGILARVNRTFKGYVAYFNEPHTRSGDFLALIDWGDKSHPTTGHIHKRAEGRYAVIGTHRYIFRGDYNVTVTIKDKLGRKLTATSIFHASL